MEAFLLFVLSSHKTVLVLFHVWKPFLTTNTYVHVFVEMTFFKNLGSQTFHQKLAAIMKDPP